MKTKFIAVSLLVGFLSYAESQQLLKHDAIQAFKQSKKQDSPVVTCKSTNKEFPIQGPRMAFPDKAPSESTIAFMKDVKLVFSQPTSENVTYTVFKNDKTLRTGKVTKGTLPTRIDINKNLASCIYTLSPSELFQQTTVFLPLKEDDIKNGTLVK